MVFDSTWGILLGVVIVLFIAVCWFIVGDCDLSLLLAEKFGKKASSLSRKIVWITGASSGIGEHLAYELAAAGCQLVLSARRVDELERVKRNCLSCSNLSEEDIFVCALDIADLKSHGDVVDTVLSRFKIIDVLVNNAGRGQHSPIMETSLEVDQKVFEINTLGTISLTKLVLPHMMQRRQGQLVVTSSIAGKLGYPNGASYSMSKFALHGWFESLRMELFSLNIDVCMVCPGPVHTNIRQYSFSGDAQKLLGGKMGEDTKRVTSARCAALIGVAIANHMEEVWISLNPYLLLTYMTQYMPTIGVRLGKRLGTIITKRSRGKMHTD